MAPPSDPIDKAGANRPKRARIELLVRGRDGDGFETREVPSASAYLGSRPQRIPDGECELARLSSALRGAATYVLKNRRTEDYLLLTEPERFLWEQMDGQASLQDIGTAYVLRYGAFDFDIIPGLISKLRRAQLLTMRPASRLREVLARNQKNPAARAAEAVLHALEKLTVTSRTSHDFFERIYRYGAFLLFTPVVVLVLAVLTALGTRGAMLLWGESGEVTAGLARHRLEDVRVDLGERGIARKRAERVRQPRVDRRHRAAARAVVAVAADRQHGDAAIVPSLERPGPAEHGLDGRHLGAGQRDALCQGREGSVPELV